MCRAEIDLPPVVWPWTAQQEQETNISECYFITEFKCSRGNNSINSRCVYIHILKLHHNIRRHIKIENLSAAERNAWPLVTLLYWFSLSSGQTVAACVLTHLKTVPSKLLRTFSLREDPVACSLGRGEHFKNTRSVGQNINQPLLCSSGKTMSQIHKQIHNGSNSRAERQLDSKAPF